jgi:uncharacterized protein YecT (DUF1311 family)
MPRLALSLAACLAAFAAAGPAAAAVMDLWALDKQGKPAKAVNFSPKTRVYSEAEHKELNAAFKKRFRFEVVYCNQKLMVDSTQKRWIAAHEKAGNRVVLRERQTGGRFRNVC